MVDFEMYPIAGAILRHFDLEKTPYDEQFADRIAKQRRAFPDEMLFLDRLFDLVQIRAHELYPPKHPQHFKLLLKEIMYPLQPVDRLKKDCFHYYLLKDHDAYGEKEVEAEQNGESSQSASRGSRTSKAAAFARRRCLPRMWTVFVDGYWALDNSQWEEAVACLSDPAITQLDFVPKIMTVLATNVSPPTQALSLIHSLLQSTHYLPTTPSGTEIHLLALASYSVPAAFAFIRSIEAMDDRTRLREAVWCWALGSPRGPCGNGKHTVQKRAMEEILHLPLLPEEDAHLVHFLSRPPKTIPTARLSLLHDLVTLRLVHSGQYAESLQLDRDLAGSAAGSEADRQRRRETIREFIAILPEAQRRVLRTEGDAAAGRREQDSQDMVNGFRPDEEMTIIGAQSQAVEEDEPMEEQRATLPPFSSDSLITHVSSNAILGAPAPASAAAPATPRARVSSPFGGPPRFASGSGLAQTLANSPSRRTLSGSPFNVPANIGEKSTPAPKQPKEIFDDDEIVARRRSGRRQTLSQAMSVVPTEVDSVRKHDADEEAMPPPPVPAKAKKAPKKDKLKEASVPPDDQNDHDTPAEKPERASKARRQTRSAAESSAQQKAESPRKAKAMSPPPAPPPAAMRTSSRRRQSTARRQTRASSTADDTDETVMPGSFETSRSVIEPSPARSTRQTSAVPESVGERRRFTRSASRALLDEDEPERASKKQRSTRAPSAQPTSSAEPSATPRRSTRRAGTAQPSEAGSPTPSVVSIAASTRSTWTEGGARASALGESATPRATRSKR